MSLGNVNAYPMKLQHDMLKKSKKQNLLFVLGKIAALEVRKSDSRMLKI